MTEDLGPEEYRALARFRYQIRRFLHFSESAAKEEGLEPQQHQALLAIRAFEHRSGPTIGELAGLLFVQHHSAVGLIDRLVQRDLVERAAGMADRRQVQVRLSRAGTAILKRLSERHREELRTTGPVLVAALGSLLESGDYVKEENV